MIGLSVLNGTAIASRRKKKFFMDKGAEHKSKAVSPAHSQIFSELEVAISGNLKPPRLTSGCACRICLDCKEPESPEVDYFGTSPAAHEKMFKLLLHLTSLELEQAPNILGKLAIPMFFFCKERGPCAAKDRPKLPRSNSFVREGEYNKQRPLSFIMFESDEKTGRLKPPQLVNSINKVMNLLKAREERIRKVKENEQFIQIKDFNRQLQSEVIIRNDNMNQEIPSFFLSSTINATLRQNSIRPVSYILHSAHKSQGQLAQTRIKDTEPFCLFRYRNEQDQGKTALYEIFTLGKLEIFTRKSHEGHSGTPSLPITCVESFTRAKMNPIFTKKLVEGIFAMLNLKPKPSEQRVPVVYYAHYCEDSPRNDKCEIFQLAELEVLLNTSKINRLDPSYMDQFELEARLSELLGKDPPCSEHDFKVMAHYLTYKIVHVLRHVCKVAVMELQLRWILSENDELVLVECPEFRVDIPRSCASLKNKDTRKHQILTKGLDMLKDNYYLQDPHSDSLVALREILAILAIEHRSRRHNEEAAEHFENKKINQISKSMDFKRDRHSAMPQSGLAAIQARKLSTNFQSTKNSSPMVESKVSAHEKFPLLRNILEKAKRPRNHNKYRLRAFKTEESEASRQSQPQC